MRYKRAGTQQTPTKNTEEGETSDNNDGTNSSTPRFQSGK